MSNAQNDALYDDIADWWAEQNIQEWRRWEEEQLREMSAENPDDEHLKRTIERRYGRIDSKTV